MDSAITQAQVKKIEAAVQPMLNYLYRLRTRIEKRGFPMKDKYYLDVCAAYDAMQQLFVATHYMTCDGVGQPPRETGTATDPVG